MTKDTAALRDGWVYDLATGKPVDMRKPEEQIRQAYERVLHEDYGYEYAQMDIEVFIQRGSRTATTKVDKDRADIVIYKTTNPAARDQHSDILGIVETKRRERKDGVRQLMSYMSACSCEWGVWTNEDEIEYIFHDFKNGAIKRDYIFQIPRSGETIAEMGRLTKESLQPAHSLKPIFRRILKTLYSNTNISRREKLGGEMIRLLFAKIWDERYDTHMVPEFRVSIEDKPKDVKQRVSKLFSSGKS